MQGCKPGRIPLLRGELELITYLDDHRRGECRRVGIGQGDERLSGTANGPGQRLVARRTRPIIANGAGTHEGRRPAERWAYPAGSRVGQE
jgi:hypothetical protein